MSNDEPPTHANSEAKKSSWRDWIWPSLVGAIIVKLFGPVGALVTIGAFYWIKPKLGTLGATAASGVLGVAVAIGLSIVVTNNFSAQPALAPNILMPQSTGASETKITDRQQLDLLRAAKLVIERFPELDVESPNRDQAAIDYVVRVRDGYLAKGHAIDIALRMAANDYAKELHRQTQVRLNQNAAEPSNSHGSSKIFTYTPSAHIQQDGRPKCNIQAVMTDAEITACR